MKQPVIETVILERIVGGGQTMGTLASGKRVFAWGGLPGETVRLRVIRSKSSFADAIVEEVLEAAPERIVPRDDPGYMSTSPWQVMDFAAEQQIKASLISEAFEMHKLVLPEPVEIYSDEILYGYRNKVEFSWWWDTDTDSLDLAFFKRGGNGKQPVDGTSLARDEINTLARSIRDLLRSKAVEARTLKTLMIRCTQDGACVWQLYVKDKLPHLISAEEAATLPAQGGEVIYSDPKSPASRITKRLASYGDIVLRDEILSVPFHYAAEGFFQVNLPVYVQALQDMRRWVEADRPVVDMYSGVGSIGLTIGGPDVTLVEIDENAYREMQRNVTALGVTAQPVLAAAEQALEHITPDATVIVDPPRAGLHRLVIDQLLEAQVPRIIYLSCNPVTQARDIALLAPSYRIAAHRGYNFFPRTPHIEHLVVLDRVV